MVEAEQLTQEEYDELQQQGIEQATGQYGYPKPPDKDNLFKFFKHLIEKPDSSKIGNLNKIELGDALIPVRAWQSLALYAQKEQLNEFSDFLAQEGQILLHTSASLKGFYPTLFVTQIKQEKKATGQVEKRGWFSKKPNPDEERGV